MVESRMILIFAMVGRVVNANRLVGVMRFRYIRLTVLLLGKLIGREHIVIVLIGNVILGRIIVDNR
jgi:hypothetical protein